MTARQAPDTHGNSLPFVLCPWGPLPWLRGNQGLPPVPSGTVREVWTKPGLLGPDRPPGLEPGGIPEERRTLPAEWFNPHSFHKQPLSSHCMPITGHILPWSEAGIHPAGHPMENMGSLAPEVPARRGPDVSTPCSGSRWEGPEFLEQRFRAYDEACRGVGPLFWFRRKEITRAGQPSMGCWEE